MIDFLFHLICVSAAFWLLCLVVLLALILPDLKREVPAASRHAAVARLSSVSAEDGAE